MKLGTSLVYDASVDTSSGQSSLPFDAGNEIYSFQIIASESAGSGDPIVWISAETSDDGVRWTTVTGGGADAGGGYIVRNKTLARGDTAIYYAYITASTDTLKHYLRISCSNSAGSSSCRIKIYMTTRVRITPKSARAALASATESGGCSCFEMGPSAQRDEATGSISMIQPGLLPPASYAMSYQPGGNVSYLDPTLWPHFSMPCDANPPNVDPNDPLTVVTLLDEVKPPGAGDSIPKGGNNTIEIHNVWPVNTAGQKLGLTSSTKDPHGLTQNECAQLVCKASLWIYDFVLGCWHFMGTRIFPGEWYSSHPRVANSYKCYAGENDLPWMFIDMFNTNQNWFIKVAPNANGAKTSAYRTKIRVQAIAYFKNDPSDLKEAKVLWALQD